MRPVEDIRFSLVGDNDVGRIEISVAKFQVFRHALELSVKVVLHGFVEVRFRNFRVHLVFKLVELGTRFRLNFELKIYEQFEIFLSFIGIFRHKTVERFALDIFGNYRPFAFYHGNGFDFGNVKPRFFNARLIERFG